MEKWDKDKHEFADCESCGGTGTVIEQGHHPECSGRCENCPIPVPATCDDCLGNGLVVATKEQGDESDEQKTE